MKRRLMKHLLAKLAKRETLFTSNFALLELFFKHRPQPHVIRG